MNLLLIPPHDLITNHNPSGLYQLARCWQHRHTIFLLRYPNYPTSINVERSFKHIPVMPSAKPAKNPGTYYIRNFGAIYDVIDKVMSKEPIEVVIHANVLPSFVAVRLAMKYRKRTVFNYRDHFPESASVYYRNPILKKLVYTLTEIVTKYNAENSDAIIAVSYAFRYLIRRYTKNPIHVIPNGIDTQLFKPLSKDRSRSELSLEGCNPIILYYGSITEWIDYKSMLYVTAQLKQKYPDILLLLVGKIYKAYEEKEIKEKIKQLELGKNVIIHPPQPQERIPIYISASDIVLVPHKKSYLTYTTPLKIPEALACERPVIATNIHEFKIWYRDFVEYYETKDQLKNKIITVLENYEHFVRKAKKARMYVTNNFDWNEIARKYEKLFTR